MDSRFSFDFFFIDLFNDTSIKWSLDHVDTFEVLWILLAGVAFIEYSIVLLCTTITLIACKLYLHKPSGMLEMGDVVPGVSIIKPLMGVDPLLEYNLESHFKLAYPKFELLFCCHDDQDDAIPLVDKLHKRYPHVDMKLLIGGAKDVVNPMVQNMAPAYEAARYEFVWISSSRIEASDAILNDMISKLQILNVALVHQMPYITGGHGFGANVEKIYFGAFHAKFYIAFNMLGFICVTGMSYMFKKTLLDQVNGLAWYGRYLAEDYFLTTALHERGRLVLSAYPAKQNVGQTTLRGFADRQIRWSKLRLNMMPLVEVLESFSYCSHLGVISALTLHHFLAINPYNFFLAHVLLWIILDYIILSYIENGPLLLSKFEFLKCWLVRELSATYILVVALLNPHIIKWHHRTFRVRLGGLTEQVKDEY